MRSRAASLVVSALVISLAGAGFMAMGAMLFGPSLETIARHPPAPSPPQPLNLLNRAQITFGKKLYSQYDEETLIRLFFKDRRNGFFVDIGSAACCEITTTFFLELTLGWKGIAVDANPAYAERFRLHRGNTKFFSYYVSDVSDADSDFYFVPEHPALASGDKARLERYLHGMHNTTPIQKTRIPTISMNDLLAREKVKRIDFLSMDIEGTEPVALAGFDIDKYQPELVCIEINPETTDRLLEYFTRHHYRRIDEYLPFDKQNWYFTPAKDKKF